jgi:hypothetical protein
VSNLAYCKLKTDYKETPLRAKTIVNKAVSKLSGFNTILNGGKTMKALLFPIVLFTFAIVFLLASTSHALRCGYGLVQEGDIKVQVLEACGDPILIELEGTTWKWSSYGRGAQNLEVIVEKWHYDIGGGVIHVLTFTGTELVDIDHYRK